MIASVQPTTFALGLALGAFIGWQHARVLSVRINLSSTRRMFGIGSQVSVGNAQTLELVASKLTASRLAKFVREGALSVESIYAPNWLI